MTETSRRAALYLVGALSVMTAFALVYDATLSTFEGQSVTFFEALSVVVQSFTTTGYGEQADLWSHPVTFVLVVLMQLTGVALVFLTLPTLVVPLIDEALSTTPPTSTEQTDHVVVAGWSPTGESLVEELTARDYPYVVLERDGEVARDLHEAGHEVVHGDPERETAHRAANVPEARAVVAGIDDETNASVILSAKRSADGCTVLSVVEDDDVADYHRYAGADDVVSPRRTLGRSLAAKATDPISADLGGAITVGEDLDVAELIVHRGSPMEGCAIADCGVSDVPGTHIIGAWFRGEFTARPAPERVVDEHTILLVAGPSEGLTELKELTSSEARRRGRGHVVVAGLGVTGTAAAEHLARSERELVVVDLEDKPSVDVVGDVTDSETLREADIEDARSLLLAVDDDTTAVFATLVARRLAPQVEVIARAADDDNVANLYQAGAEYVLARSTVSGRELASKLLDEEVVTPDSQVEIVRRTAPALAGQRLDEADIRARTNCTVVAVERDGRVVTDVGPDLVVRDDDTLVVAGDDDAIQRFSELAG